MTEVQAIGEILEELLKSGSDITRAILITARGVVTREAPGLQPRIGSYLIDSPKPLSNPEFALFGSALVNLAHTLLMQDTGGDLEEIFMSCADDFSPKTLTSTMKAGSRAILTIFTPSDVKFGYAWIESKKACKKIEKVIPPDFPDIVVTCEGGNARKAFATLLKNFAESLRHMEDI